MAHVDMRLSALHAAMSESRVKFVWRVPMSRTIGSLERSKTIQISQLVMAGLDMAPPKPVQNMHQLEALPELNGMKIGTLKRRLKAQGFKIVSILALQPIS